VDRPASRRRSRRRGGEAEIAGHRLGRRDSVALHGEQRIDITVAGAGTDLLLVETRL
jgi:hypothetical protein